ncbi:MAG TPA: hypothetical protein VNY27_02060 [Solirubrobacteraceae bacterium]|jgi:cytochrome P450|nr:hypothetical protein [Solirubrobacteraceae bacterium]
MAVQTFLAVFFTERFAGYCRRRFDSLVTLRLAGLGEVVSIFDPELIKALFTGDPDRWLAGRANAKVLQAPAGASSVLVLDGEEHMRMRRLLLPAFHGDAVHARPTRLDRSRRKRSTVGRSGFRSRCIPGCRRSPSR